MSVTDRIQTQAFMRASRAGRSKDECKASAREVVTLYKERRDAGDPLALELATTTRDLQAAFRENARLMRVRDELLAALAQALGVTESEAWQIARLDFEEDE
jgi:hypothetical protein